MLKIVITGASGFLGTHVLKYFLEKDNVEVIPVSRKKIPGFYTVSDYGQSPHADILIHLADDNDRARVAQRDASYEDRSKNTLNSLLEKRYSRIVYASSGVLYGDFYATSREINDHIEVSDRYSKIKFQSELAVLKTSSGIVARISNVYGPGMSKANVVSKILAQIPGCGALQVANKNPIRDFIWVEDVAAGLASLAMSNFDVNQNNLFNISTGIGTSIEDVARLALQIGNQPSRDILDNSDLMEASTLILDNSQIKSICRWQPKISLLKGISTLLKLQRQEGA